MWIGFGVHLPAFQCRIPLSEAPILQLTKKPGKIHPVRYHIDGLVQERRNSSALAMELRLSCTADNVIFPAKIHTVML